VPGCRWISEEVRTSAQCGSACASCFTETSGRAPRDTGAEHRHVTGIVLKAAAHFVRASVLGDEFSRRDSLRLTDTDKLLPFLCDVVRAGVSGDHLLTATRKLLYENRFVIPGTRRLSNLMQGAIARVEHESLSMIERSIPVLIRNRWLDARRRQRRQVIHAAARDCLMAERLSGTDEGQCGICGPFFERTVIDRDLRLAEHSQGQCIGCG
jgi:hypothetical protein